MNEGRPHTTIGLKKATKQKLDKARAPGQCYDGFLCQLVDFWQESHIKSRPVEPKKNPVHLSRS